MSENANADRGIDPRHRDTGATPVYHDPVPADEPATVREALAVDGSTRLEREREAFGGMKIGSAFFGWLTATGAVVLLTALVAGAGLALGFDVAEATEQMEDDAARVGLVGSIAFLVIVLVGYFCGGYVAGRMARFNGAKQGFAVWLWAVVIGVAGALVGVIGGEELNVWDRLDGVTLPTGADELTTAGIIGLVVLAVVSLLGAVLGGVAGMRFHRRVDRTSLDDGYGAEPRAYRA